jgi:pyruvate,water dikinase
MVEVYQLKEKGPALVHGRSVGEKIAQGPVRVVKSAHNLHEVRQGDVLVTDKTDPDWEPTMKKAAAIVTNRGGRTCHAAIVSRELMPHRRQKMPPKRVDTANPSRYPVPKER